MRAVPMLALLTVFGLNLSPAADAPLSGPAAELYQKARGGKWFATAAALHPEILPTSDERSFLVVWKPAKEPKRWIVSLPGTEGFATDDLALWAPQLKNRDAGLISVQWWLGTDGPGAYYTPVQIYREIDAVLRKVGAQPGAVMLHGFSRGSANSYAVVALDAGRGSHYFALAVASSGGVALDYGPTRAILNGDYGEHPLKSTRWITAAGAKDSHPDRDGIAGMKCTAGWLKEQGAIVLESIEDPKEGHGALQRNPKNLQHVLDVFFAREAAREAVKSAQ